QDQNRVLIEMEVAQFYYICGLSHDEKALKYAAIKGAANVLGDASQQLNLGPIVVERTLAATLQLLNIAAKSDTAAGDAKPNDDPKLLEEVKLYWTVQLGALTALGLLAGGFKEQTYIVPLAVITLALIYGVSAYNVLGNFFIWQARRSIGTERE